MVTTILERLPDSPDGKEAVFRETLPPDERVRGDLLERLVEDLPEQLVGWRSSRCSRSHTGGRSKLLGVLLDRLNGQARAAALAEALEAARAIPDERARAELLAELAGRLSGEGAEAGLADALRTACAIRNDYFRAEALGPLVQRLPERLALEALEPVRAIGLEVERAQLLAALADRLRGSAGGRAGRRA